MHAPSYNQLLTQGVSDGFPPGVSDVQAQELAAKIAENERLHMKVDVWKGAM